MSVIIKRQVGWVSAITLGLLMQAAFADKVYVSDSKGIEVIDTDNNRVINTLYDVGGDIPNIFPQQKLAVNPDGTRLYVINKTEQKLSVIDTKTDKVLNDIPLSLSPLDVSYGKTITVNPSGTQLYVVSLGGDQYVGSTSMLVVDTVTNKNIVLAKSYNINRIVFNPSGEYFYGFNDSSNILVFSTKTNNLITTISLNDRDMNGGGMATAGNNLYLTTGASTSTSYEHSITVINTQSNQVIATIPMGRHDLKDIRVNSEGTRLYACALTDVLVFNLTNNTLETTIPMIGGFCDGIEINASGTRIYVSKGNYKWSSSVLYVIDVESKKIVSTVSLNPNSGITHIAVASSAITTPIPRATARISNLNAQAKLPIIGGLGISGTGTLNLLFQGSASDTCISPSMTLRKYPSGEVVDNYNYYGTAYSAYMNGGYYTHQSTAVDLLSRNPKDVALVWDLPAGYYTVSLDALGCNEQGKFSIDIIEEDSSSSAKLVNVSANAMLPITSSVTLKGTESIQTMFRGFKVDSCVDANLELKNSTSGALLASNDNWEADVNITAAKALPQYLQPIDSSDAGLLRQLGAQSVTATLSSKNACQGDGVFGMDITP
jgi:YVTN family beta-propeller protein